MKPGPTPPASATVPVRLRWPDAARFAGPWPVVIFSHGLGGTREGGTVWGEAWAAAGFVVVHLQHPGSDLAAVRGVTNTFTDQRALRSLAGPQQLLARLRDVGFALDEIGRRHAAGQGRWSAVRPTQVGMAGHSFGAHTTMGMAGQRYPAFEGIAEPRLAAFIAFSPTVPVMGDAHRAFERLNRPLLSITGTRDADVAGVGATPERRMAVFGALPPGDKAHLVLQDADHMTFGGQTGRRCGNRAARGRHPRTAGRAPCAGGRHHHRLVARHAAGRRAGAGKAGGAAGPGRGRCVAAEIAPVSPAGARCVPAERTRCQPHGTDVTDRPGHRS